MAVKPETTFYNAINKLLPKSIYHMKNNNPYVGGIPDVWYSGNNGDMWIEYKYLPNTPTRAIVDPKKLLSALQLQWLDGRYDEGRSVGVIIGCPNGAIVLTDKNWHTPLTPAEFKNHLQDKRAVATFIRERVST